MSELSDLTVPQCTQLRVCLAMLRVSLKAALLCDGGVSPVLKSSCIRPYTPVFRALLPCAHKKIKILEVPLGLKASFNGFPPDC